MKFCNSALMAYNDCRFFIVIIIIIIIYALV